MGLKTKAAIAAALTAGMAFAGYQFLSSDREIVDISHNGAYQFEDGSVVSLVPSTPQKMRFRHLKDGAIHSLYHDGNGNFEAAEGFSSTDIVATGKFDYSQDGDTTGVTWVQNGKTQTLKRLPLRREMIHFKSGDLNMRGELTLPQGEGPFPVVVMVHGSESYSGVDFYHLPYLLAAKGIAGFKFDKRGTGDSDGEYTQHFPTLASDVIAGVKTLKGRSDIDAQKINLIGLSQGGWISPLVAKQIAINSYIVGFGTTVPIPEEDRWGYVKRLQERGFGQAEIAKADELNAQLQKIIFEFDEDAWDGLFAMRDKYQDEDWFKATAGSDSLLGFVTDKLTDPLTRHVPGFGWKLYTKWRQGSGGDNFNRTYDPMETLRQVDSPSLWLLAGEDSSLPTPDTVDDLKTMQTLGKPVEYKVYPGAEHGNVTFEMDESGRKTYTGYVPTYFTDIVEWFRQQNGIQ